MRLGAFFFLLSAACGSAPNDAPDAGDAGAADVKHDAHKLLEASLDTGSDEEASTAWNRMTPHSDIVIGSMRLRAIYVKSTANAPGNFDSLLAWMLQSTDYWSILAEYGVGYGTADSVTVDASTFFATGDVVNGFVDGWSIGHAIQQMPPDDAGPAPNAYIVFLPSDIAVESPPCSSFLGYHTTTGTTPYAVVPFCGAQPATVSHELAEMATDPIPFAGWYSEADESPAGGEVGDLCNPGVSDVDNHYVATLWSNALGDCEPH